MEQLKKTRWEGNEHWFKFDHHAGLKRFDEISTLGSTATAVALRSVKYQLENELGFEVSDNLFCEIFKKVCNFRPVPALGCYAPLEFIQPLQRILEKHGVSGKNVGAIWRTFRVRVDNPRCYGNLLLHIPHSSSSFPTLSKYTWNDLDEEERLLIDYYTDELFVPQQESERISSVIFPYCRLYCDVERLINDPLDKDGLGISYIREVPAKKGYTFRSFSTSQEAFIQYVDFHGLVSKKLYAMGDNTLIIDCHSFSNLPTLLCSNPPDIDICIGYNDDETCPDKVVIGNIVHHFESFGYKVGINKPFSNSKTFAVPTKYHSLMIEINKRIYMDEFTYIKYDCFNHLKREIQSLYNLLLNIF
jgi:N-formylglutamate amidohydrolase